MKLGSILIVIGDGEALDLAVLERFEQTGKFRDILLDPSTASSLQSLSIMEHTQCDVGVIHSALSRAIGTFDF
jgi:hypothetical protein